MQRREFITDLGIKAIT